MQVISQRYDPADYYEERRELTADEEREAQIGQLSDEAGLAWRKAIAIQKLLNGETLSQLTVPTERLLLDWHVMSLIDEAKRTENRIKELEMPATSRKDQLKDEWKMLQQTWMIAENSQSEITRRQSQIEEELTKLEEVAYVASA